MSAPPPTPSPLQLPLLLRLRLRLRLRLPLRLPPLPSPATAVDRDRRRAVVVFVRPCRRRCSLPLWSVLAAAATVAFAVTAACDPAALVTAAAAAVDGGRRCCCRCCRRCCCRYCRRCCRPLPASPPAATATAAAGRTIGGEGHWHRVESLAIAVCPSQPLPVGPIMPAPALSLLTPVAWRRCRKPRPPPPASHAAASLLLTMVDPGLLRLPRSVAEVLGTGSIPAELAAILAEHSRTVRKDGTARTPEKRTARGLHDFLSNLALGKVPVPGLEKVTLVGVDEDGRVHLMHLLFSVRVNVYSTECCLFACVGELPTEGLPQVTDILPDCFAARRSVCAVPRIDHVSHLGGFFPL